MIHIGVDHIGSVLLSAVEWKQPLIRETIVLTKDAGARASLIPLFSEPDTVFSTLDYYRPDVVHFCDDLIACGKDRIATMVALQQSVQKRFSDVSVMRSIPVPRPGVIPAVLPAKWAQRFESVSDYFLTDTHIGQQPVQGFIGITGCVCDWGLAADLVQSTDVPVILAGGVGPENVYDSITAVRPAGVDSCTGTNMRDDGGHPVRFKKDHERVARLVEAVRRAERDMSAGSDALPGDQ